jgi:hypothetical protein
MHIVSWYIASVRFSQLYGYILLIVSSSRAVAFFTILKIALSFAASVSIGHDLAAFTTHLHFGFCWFDAHFLFFYNKNLNGSIALSN